MDTPSLEADIRRRCPSMAEQVIDAIEPCARLVVSPTTDIAIPAAATKIGGQPDLPADFTWPVWTPPAWEGNGDPLRRGPGHDAAPLEFLAQVNLGDAATTGVTASLPGHGLLSFFADVRRSSGLFPTERDGFRVLWFPDTAELERHRGPYTAPLHSSGIVTFVRAPSIPDETTLPLAGIDVPGDEADRLDLIRQELDDEVGSPARHQWLGHATGIHHPVLDRAVQSVNDCFVADSFDARHWERLRNQTRRWRLLLQIDSDEQLGLMWGDAGRLYFVGERAALRAHTFDRTWFNIQD